MSRVGTFCLALALLLVAANATAQPRQEPTCASRVASFALQNAKPRHRLILTFTGSQAALTPLWEMASGPHLETIFFPIDRERFVLTVQVRVGERPNLTQPALGAWAKAACDKAAAHGARYNGALAFSGNDLVEADMSLVPTK